MNKRDWITAAAIATAVCTGTLLIALPQAIWADGQKIVAIPQLLPAALAIPSLEAKVTAAAEPVPGQAVRVLLQLEASADKVGREVPVTVTVSSLTDNPMSRVPFVRPKPVCNVASALSIGEDGRATTIVEMPSLTWATPTPAPQPDKPNPMAVRTRYVLTLSSSLVPEAAGPVAMRALVEAQQQVQ